MSDWARSALRPFHPCPASLRTKVCGWYSRSPGSPLRKCSGLQAPPRHRPGGPVVPTLRHPHSGKAFDSAGHTWQVMMPFCGKWLVFIRPSGLLLKRHIIPVLGFYCKHSLENQGASRSVPRADLRPGPLALSHVTRLCVPSSAGGTGFSVPRRFSRLRPQR